MHVSDVIVFRVATRSLSSSGIEVMPARSAGGLCVKAVLCAVASDATVLEKFGWLDSDSELDPAVLAAEVRRETSEDCIIGADFRGCKSEDGTVEASDPVAEYDRLGGRDARCDDMDDVRLFTTGESDGVNSDRLLVCDIGRKNDTVLDLRRACRSIFSFSSSSTVFLTSGSLYSSFPFLSDAKYSSPRPKTT